MQRDKFRNYLHLHLLVFIAGFTAILGELISISAVPLVWFRMVMAGLIMYLFIRLKGINIRIDRKTFVRFSIAGIFIALHWITFFASIKQANISIALSMFSTGAFFTALIEPVVFKRRIIWYEIMFGLAIILGVIIITQAEFEYLNGIILGVFSALFASLFAVINGMFVKRHSPSVISFYEFISGVFFITLYIIFFMDGFDLDFFQLSIADYSFLIILASICTAYAFIAAVHIMRYLSPYTVVLSYNLEPVYGILLAIVLFPQKEKMSFEFYVGAAIIIIIVILNGILKNSGKLKRPASE
jgi:drug/metabolite transporter (DMT)-like permease